MYKQTIQNLNSCNCCEGLSLETPVKIKNRPGLHAICYRVGIHAKFKESLLAGLSLSRHPVLRQLSARKDDDFTVALLDAWSCVADILTFYQERLANESYLGTATERFSILELARLIGYELNPGVAAGTWLVFTLEEVPGKNSLSPAEKALAEIPPQTLEAGIKVQSVPGTGETAQTFETVEAIQARSEWNAMQPKRTQQQAITTYSDVIVVDGTANDLKPGDILLIQNGQKLKRIVQVEMDTDSKITTLYLKMFASLPSYAEPLLSPDGNVADYTEKVALTGSVIDEIRSKTWYAEDLSTIAETQGWSLTNLKYGIDEAVVSGTTAETIYVFRQRASVFGYNALKQVTYNGSVPKKAGDWEEWSLNESYNTIYLDSVNNQILSGSYIAVQKSGDSIENSKTYCLAEANASSRTEYGLSAKTTELKINNSAAWWDTKFSGLAAIRSITVHAQSVPLTLALAAIEDNVEGDTITLNGFFLGLKTGRPVVLTGERSDLEGVTFHELHTLKEVYIHKGFTVLKFETALDYSYIRSTVTINANVAIATHGETVEETLGSGNAATIFQKFSLKQSPLTYVSDSSASGALSTLEIRVNDILWHEVPSFYGRGAVEHIYITRLNDEGQTTVIFGDGINGSRVPTGTENIRATYRKGIGTVGLVKANQISQLMTRPLGVKSAVNPFITTGAQDMETLEDARQNAKFTISTLGKIISLQDYEDFARAFAGISKALATWTWSGQKRCIYLTVAGAEGQAVDTESETYENLLIAIKESGIPGVPVTVVSYQPRYFKVSANIQVHPDYLPESVLENIATHLRDSFSFDNREFGQTVAFSEVNAVMQQVEGVLAVDIDEFYRSDETSDINNRLYAEVPRPGTDTAFPAELLTLDSGLVNLKTML